MAGVFTFLAVACVIGVAAPEPVVLSLARGWTQAAQSKVAAAQGVGNAAIRAGSEGVNLLLDAVQGLEAVESNLVRGALNAGRGLGTEALTQTRGLTGTLPSGTVRNAAGLGVGLAQRGLDAGVDAAILVANSTQAVVNRTVAAGQRASGRVSSAAQGAVNVAAGVANRLLAAQDRALAGVQNVLRGNATGGNGLLGTRLLG